MNDASERYARQIEIAQQAAGRGDRKATAEALKAAISTTRGHPALHHEHAAALVRLASLAQEIGRPADAERLLTEAIAVGERHVGANDPSLGVALNELSRLHVRQSDYARAEPVLKRLLTIARTKGDSHPDVATALAGLAVAKRGLGQNAAAEVLYRHALVIREEVLAPDHMAIVVTLEQLAETCATRGNAAEALVYLRRALPQRERALGADHATVRALRTRVADLERRVAKPAAKPAERVVIGAAPATEAARAPVVERTLVSTPAPGVERTLVPAREVVAEPALVAAPQPEPAPAPRPSGDWRATPARPRFFASTATQPRPSGELKFLYQPVPTASRPPAPAPLPALTPAPAVAAVSSSAIAPALPSYSRSVALEPSPAPARSAPVADLPVPVAADAPVSATSSSDLADIFASFKRTSRYASAGAAVVVLAIVGSEFGMSAEPEAAPPSGASAAETPVAVAPTADAKSPAASRSSAGAPASLASHTASSSAAAPSKRSSEESDAAPSVAVPTLKRLVIPKVAVPSVDSLVRSAERIASDPDTQPKTIGAGVLGAAPSEYVGVTPPVLLFAPALRFPDELRARPIDGEVVVQFRVNEKGRVEASSMQVLQSQHELFTAAVRSVLPRFRFEPARSPAPGAKPQAAWVQFRAQFTARN